MLLISELMKDELSNNKSCYNDFDSLETSDQIINASNNAEMLHANEEVENEEDIELQMRRMNGEMESVDANINHTKSLGDTRKDVLNIKTVVDFTNSPFQSNEVSFDLKDSVNSELKSIDKDGSSEKTELELGPSDKNIKDFASNGDDAKHQSNENKELMNKEKAINLKDKEDNLQETFRYICNVLL